MHPIPWLEDVQRGVAYDNTISLFRRHGVILPTLHELAEPKRIRADVQAGLAEVDPDAADPLNLFRVHWYNAASRRQTVGVPEHLVLPASLTGVDATIVVALANRFPLIGAHKVLAAYGCLIPRLVSGHFDALNHQAIWPSTGNYCRGGVAISRLLGCQSVAVLPEGMSQERFDWLSRWVSHPSAVIRTIGSESNVREIYNKCHELEAHPGNVVFNQFREFSNYLVHYLCTGRALADVFEAVQRRLGSRALRAFVAATGSGGTLAAGDYLKERFGSRIVAAEPLECATMLYNGFGEHNIQGIGDKHISLIHNVMNTDLVAAVSDRATDTLNVLFNTERGHAYLAREHGVDPGVLSGLGSLGLSSICNILAAIKTSKLLGLGAGDVVITLATDGADMYASERVRTITRDFAGSFEDTDAAKVSERYLFGVTTDHIVELGETDRRRVFNLGYYTWVEQEGVSADDFEARANPQFWVSLRALGPTLDRLISELNAVLTPGSIHA